MHADPSPEQDPNLHADPDEKPKDKRPQYNDFRQQRLKAWQPILTPRSVLPVFFSLAVIFAPLGGVLLWASNQVQEVNIDYTDCKDTAPVAPNWGAIPSEKWEYLYTDRSGLNHPQWQRNASSGPITCTVTFDIPKRMGPPIYLFYKLTNFYQNHRRYTKSFNTLQLEGQWIDNQTINGGPVSSCDPELFMMDCETGKALYPAGLVANSMFNDTLYSPEYIYDKQNDVTVQYYMTNKGIAWQDDKELYKPTSYKNWEVMPPPYWRERYPNGYTDENPIPNIQNWEEFLVWMRTAGLPNFSKLARRNDTSSLVPGTYKLSIDDRFPVKEYEGTKHIMLSTRIAIGGKNSFMGIAYVAVGALCCLVGTIFTIAYVLRKRKLGDESYLSWNKQKQN